MKFKNKIILILVCLMVTSVPLVAQPYIGVFGGLNSSKLRGDVPDKASYKSLMGVNTGIYLDLKLSNMIKLSIQPSYSQEGTRIFYTLKGQEDPVDSIHIRLNYISLPLLLKISTTNQRFYAIGGVETAYLSSSSMEIGAEEEEIDADLQEWNLALQFGAGIRIPVGFGRLIVELRYSQGLTDLTNEPVDKSYIPRVKTSGFKVIACYEIPISKKEKQ